MEDFSLANEACSLASEKQCASAAEQARGRGTAARGSNNARVTCFRWEVTKTYAFHFVTCQALYMLYYTFLAYYASKAKLQLCNDLDSIEIAMIMCSIKTPVYKIKCKMKLKTLKYVFIDTIYHLEQKLKVWISKFKQQPLFLQ